MSVSGLSELLTQQRMRQYAVALFLVTAALYVAGVARSADLIEPSGQIVGRDYFAFYMAGDMVSRGRLEQLYDPQAQQAYQQRFMQDLNPRWSGTCLYLNPPHFAWAMSLIAPLGYRVSLGLWWLVSLACFVATALIWRRWLKPADWRLAVILAVCMPAWFQALAGGQNTFISLLVATLFCDLLINARPFRSGLVLSLLGYKFPLLIVPVGWLVATRRWRAAGGVLAGGVVTLVLTAAFLGPGVIADYAKFGTRLGELMQQQGFDVHKQCSWYGFFVLAGAGRIPTLSIRILAVTAVVATLLLLVPVSRVACPSRPLSSTCLASLVSRSPKTPALALRALIRENALANQSPERKRAGSIGTLNTYLDLSFQLAALLVATLATSPHLFHYDMLLATLPAVLWLRVAGEADVVDTTRAAKRPSQNPCGTGASPVGSRGLGIGCKPILVIGFVALAVTGPLAGLLHFQPLPILMTCWLVVFARCSREPGAALLESQAGPRTSRLAGHARSPAGRG